MERHYSLIIKLYQCDEQLILKALPAQEKIEAKFPNDTDITVVVPDNRGNLVIKIDARDLDKIRQAFINTYMIMNEHNSVEF